MTDRNWIPVAALSREELRSTRPSMLRLIAETHDDLTRMRRSLKTARDQYAVTDLYHPARAARWANVTLLARDIHALEARRESLLNALLWHTLDYTHMHDECVICRAEAWL